MTTENTFLPEFRLSRAAEDLVIEDWGGIQTVFQRASGETHAFNEGTVALIECLRQGPESFDHILRSVAAICEFREVELVADEIARVVLRLEELGLIERILAA